MELEELKQKWNMLDERLSKSEVYNRRMLMEMLKQNTKTIYQHLTRQGVFNGVYTFVIAAVLIPFLHTEGIFSTNSFVVLEAVCLLGLIMLSSRLYILSKFDVLDTPDRQLHNLFNYKRCYVYEMTIGAPLAIFGICATLFIEQAASPTSFFFVALGVLAGSLCAWFGYLKHKKNMREIEQNLTEQKEFEE